MVDSETWRRWAKMGGREIITGRTKEKEETTGCGERTEREVEARLVPVSTCQHPGSLSPLLPKNSNGTDTSPSSVHY